MAPNPQGRHCNAAAPMRLMATMPTTLRSGYTLLRNDIPLARASRQHLCAIGDVAGMCGLEDYAFCDRFRAIFSPRAIRRALRAS